jgi:hypothetical protein
VQRDKDTDMTVKRPSCAAARDVFAASRDATAPVDSSVSAAVFRTPGSARVETCRCPNRCTVGMG